MRILDYLTTLLLVLAQAGCNRPAKEGRAALPRDTTSAYVTSTSELGRAEIPDSVFSMTELRTLVVTGMDCDVKIIDSAGNDITNCWMLPVVPRMIGRLKNLEVLRLPLNNISALPQELIALRKLRVLDLSDNPGLVNVDPVTELPQLEELDLCGCRLSRMPTAVAALRHLKRLCLAGSLIDSAERQRIGMALPACRVVF